MKEEQIRKKVEELGVGNLFLDSKLSDFSPQQQSAIEHSLFLHGKVGCGKTHFLSAIIREYIEYPKERKGQLLPMKYIIHNGKRRQPVFLTVSEYLFKLRIAQRDSIFNEAIIVHNLINAPVLCLDDLGNTKVTDWSIQMLDLIFNGRYNNQKIQRTYITSNMEIDEIKNEFGERISSRINGMCKVVNFIGEDRRLEENK